MKRIDGVSFVKKEGYAVCHITNFSNALKKLIREQLSFVCYGAANATSSKRMYNYSNTLKEFIKRYDEKSKETQKGMIGELLIHILLNEFFAEFETISPFFNLEERSIKKGFDVVLTHRLNNSMWITEVKSGELHKNKNANGTSVDLLNTAKKDLYDRLNGENYSLWLNAINGAKIAYDSHSDLKNAVIDILENYGDDAIEGKIESKNMNVFLTSALFAPMNDIVEENTIKKKYNAINEENKFKCLFALSIQKGTYNKIYDFLQKEGQI